MHSATSIELISIWLSCWKGVGRDSIGGEKWLLYVNVELEIQSGVKNLGRIIHNGVILGPERKDENKGRVEGGDNHALLSSPIY